MKTNLSMNPLFFHFTLFSDLSPGLRPVFFSVCVCVFVTIVCVNGAVVLAVLLDPALHQPMFLFIAGLCANALCGSAAFFPRFLSDLLADAHLISRTSCLVQMYVVHSYKGQEVTLLSVMAYDRYVAVLHPLHYRGRMSGRRVRLLLAAALLYPICIFGFFFHLAGRLPLCGNRIPRFYCTCWSVVSLSCVDAGAAEAAARVLSVLAVVLPLLFVLYTYLLILRVCRRSAAEVRGKALQTCLPHILTFLNFCVAVLCEVALYRLKEVDAFVVMVLSLEFLIVPPVTNPLVYGLNLPHIRRAVFRGVRP